MSRTLYLRDDQGHTILDIEVGKEDVHGGINVQRYTEFLLRQPICDAEFISWWFHAGNEIRGWYWESFQPQWANEKFPSENNLQVVRSQHPPVQETIKAIKALLEPLTKKFPLWWMED